MSKYFSIEVIITSPPFPPGNIKLPISKNDIYKYLFSGNPVNDLRLVDQDIIYVPSRLSTIALTGQIKKPGYYEMNNNETISDLINLAGGKMLRSSEMVFLYKNNSNLNDAFLVEFDQISKIFVTDGDSIHLRG